MTGLSVAIGRKAWPMPNDGGERVVLKDVRFELAPGEVACLLGPSGCGKSTLLGLVAGLDEAFEGEVRLPEGRLAMVFQQPRLLPWRTLLQNITLIPDAEEETARRRLTEFGLAEAMHAYPERVSLGMQRRAALARALSIPSSLLLMDEPTTSLDPEAAAFARARILHALRERGAAALIATHDRREALAIADRIIELGAAPATILSNRLSPIPRERREDAAEVERAHREWFE